MEPEWRPLLPPPPLRPSPTLLTTPPTPATRPTPIRRLPTLSLPPLHTRKHTVHSRHSCRRISPSLHCRPIRTRPPSLTLTRTRTPTRLTSITLHPCHPTLASQPIHTVRRMLHLHSQPQLPCPCRLHSTHDTTDRRRSRRRKCMRPMQPRSNTIPDTRRHMHRRPMRIKSCATYAQTGRLPQSRIPTLSLTLPAPRTHPTHLLGRIPPAPPSTQHQPLPPPYHHRPESHHPSTIHPFTSSDAPSTHARRIRAQQNTSAAHPSPSPVLTLLRRNSGPRLLLLATPPSLSSLLVLTAALGLLEPQSVVHTPPGQDSTSSRSVVACLCG